MFAGLHCPKLPICLTGTTGAVSRQSSTPPSPCLHATLPSTITIHSMSITFMRRARSKAQFPFFSFMDVCAAFLPAFWQTWPLIEMHHPSGPGSILEVTKILPLLVNPSADGAPAFHVVALSLPGYGFSEGPKKPGFGPIKMGEVRHLAAVHDLQSLNHSNRLVTSLC